MLEALPVDLEDLVAPLEADLFGLGVLLDLVDEDAVAALVAAQDGEVEDLLAGRSRQGDVAHPRLGGARDVQQVQLPRQLALLQLRLERLQELHHGGVRLEVGEMVVHPQQHHPRHPVSDLAFFEPAPRDHNSNYLNRVAVISAKNHKRQRCKRQSVTAKREKSQTPKVLNAILTLPNLTLLDLTWN